MDSVELAMCICMIAHHGQKDALGNDYWQHPFAVAQLCWESAPGALAPWSREVELNDDVRVLAYLHDVPEDTSITLEALAECFDPEIIADLDALTHRKSEPRAEYIDRIRARARVSPRVRLVKNKDMDHNTDPVRRAALRVVDPERAARLDRKYARDRARLNAPL